ncbi:MAG: pullulanase-type alpha-1,6-glucosidase [Candidatus Sericytochromatia bacterium]
MKKRAVITLLLSSTLILSSCAAKMKDMQEEQKESVTFNKNKKYITTTKARWIDKNTIVWNLSDDFLSKKFTLHYSEEGDIITRDNKIHGGKKIDLKGLSKIESGDPILQKYPYLLGQLKIDTSSIEQDRMIRRLQTKNLIISVEDKNGNVLDATRLQTYGILDDLYTYTGNDLGVTFNRYNQPTLRLWAPTAKMVRILIYKNPNDAEPEKIRQMEYDIYTGVWHILGVADWANKYYKYEVEVFSPLTGNLETNYVTDPYSLSLSANGEKSQIANLNDQHNMPEGWETYEKPELNSFNDISLYELHMRDFSAKDETVPKKLRGKYLAFTQQNSNGMNHLRTLAKSGLTHVHFLPLMDFASVEENESLRKEPNITNSTPASYDTQRTIGATKDLDAYNWGYDPQHYFAPEGSYATDPNGVVRVFEFRQMVKSLHENGLRVVMDVVFNHTFTAGNNDKSVLDKIVPGYYYRLDDNGRHQNSSCCPDTATEHNMMEKLMIDSVKMWAKQYKIDGFRFDLMGHHTTDNLKKVREALDSLTYVNDGVNGREIFLYGEGWKFGSLDDKQPKNAMNQYNASGMGIGTFNDRLRDSARGGNFMTSTKSDQGFINGLYYDYNASDDNTETPISLDSQKRLLENYTDNIKIALTGGLKNYEFNGKKGSNIPYRNSAPAGYTEMPQETINYVSAHDNYCLWDQNSAKHPFKAGDKKATSSMEEKIKMQSMGLALVALGQGIPFFHAGDEILRSKSGDTDSYNSGDWFNAIDFSYKSNNWGIGLPVEWKNKGEWDFWKMRLEDPNMKPTKDDILTAFGDFNRLLKLRKDSKLFRLETEKDVIERVKFLSFEGKDPKDPTSTIYGDIPGVIAMHISDEGFAKKLDPNKKALLVVFNATKETLKATNSSLKGRNFKFHPILAEPIPFKIQNKEYNLLSYITSKTVLFDSNSGTVTVPPRTTAVFYEPRE